MAHKTVLAVDLGAESGRVMGVHFSGQGLELEELHRFPNGPVTSTRDIVLGFFAVVVRDSCGRGKGVISPAGRHWGRHVGRGFWAFGQGLGTF